MINKVTSRVHNILAIVNLPVHLRKPVHQEICSDLFRNNKHEVVLSSRLSVFEREFPKQVRWDTYSLEYKQARENDLLYIVFINEEDYDMLISAHADRVFSVAIDFERDLPFPADIHLPSTLPPTKLARSIVYLLNYAEFGVPTRCVERRRLLPFAA